MRFKFAKCTKICANVQDFFSLLIGPHDTTNSHFIEVQKAVHIHNFHKAKHLQDY